MKNSKRSLENIRTLSDPFVVSNQIYITVSHARESENDYVSDLAKVVDDAVEIVVENITDVQIVGEKIFYLKDNQLFFHHEDKDDEQLTQQINQILQFLPTPDGELLYYVSKQTKVAPFNTVTDKPTIRRYTKLHYKNDGEGFIDEDQTFQLHSIDLKATERLVKTFSLPIKLADVFTKKRILLIEQTNDEDALYLDQRLIEFDPTRDLSKILADQEIAEIAEATYSPDGHQVLFIATDQTYRNRRVAQLFRYDAHEKRTVLQFSAEEMLEGPHGDLVIKDQKRHVKWLDNDTYAFETGYHGHNRLYLASVSGEKELVRDEAEALSDFLFLEDTALAVRSTVDHPSQLINLANSKVVLDLNETYLAHQKYVFRSPDGEFIDGWFLPNAAGVKAPVVLYVHGGPHGAYGEGFFWEFQQFAQKGYNVVYVNPHGSTTYGQDFIESVVEHYGEQDFQDVLTGLDVAITQHADLIDEQQQFIAGGSYGGFMATWAIGHTNRFTAAIAQRPVTDWLALAGSSDINYNFVETDMGATPYTPEGRETLIEKSPLTYAPNVETPLLLMHGEYDMRTPSGQSEAMYTAIKLTTEANVEMVRFPQAWHGVSRNGFPNLRLARLDVMFEWLARYGTLEA
ncbi:MAG: S9 family peptidase [Lactobacillaceae bacterium]|nr:S9 family peptidase [Lactobacillaceae bacterium]